MRTSEIKSEIKMNAQTTQTGLIARRQQIYMEEMKQIEKKIENEIKSSFPSKTIQLKKKGKKKKYNFFWIDVFPCGTDEGN